MWWLFIITLSIYAELQIPVQHTQIKDIGFEITQNLHNILQANPKLNSKLALINTSILMLCNMFYILDSIFNGWSSPLVQGFTCLYLLRFIVGSLTRLPKSRDIIEDKTEIPPSGQNFFFLFSAHTMSLYLVGAHLINIYIVLIIIFLQSIRLLATRDTFQPISLSHLPYLISPIELLTRIKFSSLLNFKNLLNRGL